MNIYIYTYCIGLYDSVCKNKAYDFWRITDILRKQRICFRKMNLYQNDQTNIRYLYKYYIKSP